MQPCRPRIALAPAARTWTPQVLQDLPPRPLSRGILWRADQASPFGRIEDLRKAMSETWTRWTRVGKYLSLLRQNATGHWDGGYLRLTDGRVERGTPRLVAVSRASPEEAAHAVEEHLQPLR
jgi:hypothetical protein